jgi:putative DNA primase/helicase
MSRWLKTWVLFHGPKDTGKSTVAEVLKLMLGSAFLGQSFGKFAEGKKGGSQFAEQNLIGKLAIIDDDFSRTSSIPDGFVKKVSEEKSMTIDIKFGTSVQAVVRALPMILANFQPKTSDISDALSERALVFPFHHRIAGSDKDDARRAKMFDELPGIFVRFVAGLRRLRKRGDWLIPLDCRDAHDDWLKRSNTLNAFKAECIVPDPDSQIEPKTVFSAYKHWIKENESTPGSSHGLGRNTFYENLENLLGDRTKIRAGLEVWKGWRLHDPRFDEVEDISEAEAEWDDTGG